MSNNIPRKSFWRRIRDALDEPASTGFVLFVFSWVAFGSLVSTFMICEDMIVDMVFKPRGESILRQYIF